MIVEAIEAKNKTVSATSTHVLAIEKERKTFVASTSIYFERTAVLKNRAAELRSASAS